MNDRQAWLGLRGSLTRKHTQPIKNTFIVARVETQTNSVVGVVEHAHPARGPGHHQYNFLHTLRTIQTPHENQTVDDILVTVGGRGDTHGRGATAVLDVSLRADAWFF